MSTPAVPGPAARQTQHTRPAGPVGVPGEETVAGGTARWLRWGQHALLAALAVVCLTRAVAAGVHPAAEVGALLAFVAWYLAGIPVARRGVSGPVWFVVLTLLWGVLVLVSPENVWLAFPLWLLAGHLLPLAHGVLISTAVLVVVVAEPVRQAGSTTFAAVIGPFIGMVVALGISRAQMALVRDGIERQRLIASLYAAQEETAALTDELARVQRAAGATSERTRLSRDIHDGIAQGFSSILLLARAARTEQDPARVRELLAHLASSAAEGLEESRRVVGALAPADLDEGGLLAALHRVTDRFAAESGVAARVVTTGAVPPVPTTTEVALVRCVQGALANVRAHARAGSVVVSLDGSAEMVRVDVVDDGQGFDATDWTTRAPRSAGDGGYGLRATRARLRELGGGLALESAPGEGTALSAWLPVHDHATDGGVR
ncbi:sensor histidine kinase [Janibacter cremeus]|uniref:sensor histidine kinase n=1 Tax=Janibacter cremeus TaxID=1285192 RepID=UPI0023F81EF9|nr:sensor histidine kinase [Janibacter cremeus]WEV79399.1 sensor histidine kinase [Janibacter cremeus]